MWARLTKNLVDKEIQIFTFVNPSKNDTELLPPGDPKIIWLLCYGDTVKKKAVIMKKLARARVDRACRPCSSACSFDLF